ncbi:MAG: AraC family transcriptional regulator [Clostridia bacterium]|nr:AraC family transcriptional regulator [Clostridia bacterium]MBO5912145.1 AraC family transcriptional regulator [Clostridia bacterium]
MYFHFETKNSAYEARGGHQLAPTPHLHSHIEIVLTETGTTVAFADSAEAKVEAGDLFIAFPNQIHYYIDKQRPVEHKILIVSPDMCPEFSRIFKTMVPKIPLLKNAISNPRIAAAFENMVQCKKEEGEYSETEARGCMLILMSEIFRNVELQEKEPYDNDLVKDIITYCYENYNGDISLQDIADELHVSRCYISRLFSRRLHIGFNDYINSLRVRNACEMLKTTDMSVTEVAYAVGYNSVRTFDRSFLNVRGMTPKEYRQKAFEKK